MDVISIRVHHFQPRSNANGPGLRAVLWVQGCSLACPDCFNPETHRFDEGQLWSIDETLNRILIAHQQAPGGLEGLTISGGEPMFQHRTLANLLGRVRTLTNLSVIVFSGFTYQEIQKMPDTSTFLSHVDVLLTGRYDPRLRVAHGLLGSSNKQIIFLTNRYSPEMLADIPEAEIIISEDGDISLSGINPLEWKNDDGSH